MLSGLTPKLACQKLSVLNFDPCTCQVNEEFSLKLAPVIQDEDELQYILLQNIDAQAVQRLANNWTKQQRKQAKRKVHRSQNMTVTTIDRSHQRIDHEWLDNDMDIDDFEYLDPADWEDCEEDDAIYHDSNDSQRFDDDGVSSDDGEAPPVPAPAPAAEGESSIQNLSQSDSDNDDDESEAAAPAVMALSSFAPSVPGIPYPPPNLNPQNTFLNPSFF